MRKLIWNNTDLCVGCNRCTRNCPVETANVTFKDEEGNIKVKIDNDSCIACGACVAACQHESRGYEDDTEQFFEDLRQGTAISLFAAPAARSNMPYFGRILTWLRQLGVRKIYDVSLGADICTWAYIRYIQKHNPPSVISQPCPAIVNYCLIQKPDLLKNLSPVHSPMLCTAVYMKQYEGVRDRIAALSPCIAKGHEFEATGLVQYNVTFAKLQDYIESHFISLPAEESGFDHYESGLGSIYSMPGGLKENVEFFLGKSLRVDKSEGHNIVYKALDAFLDQPSQNLPAVFDVLNCQEGCNLGSACHHRQDIFEVNTTMEQCRQKASKGREKEYFDELYETYDRTLNLSHFLRTYTAQKVNIPPVSEHQIEEAYALMDKSTETKKNFNCGACGSDTCYEMARKIALGVNIADNCIQKSRDEIHEEHRQVLKIQESNLDNVNLIRNDIDTVKEYSEAIIGNIEGVNQSIAEYAAMASAIDNIAMHINIISLNASVEAARAGVHGRTFAVVAEEIRKLAQTSKETVARTEKVSEVATSSVNQMNNGIEKIKSAVDEAHANIIKISESSMQKK